MPEQPSIGREFILKTNPASMPEPPQKLGVPQPPLELPAPPNLPRIALTRPEDLHPPALDLRTAIETRRTLRSYRDQALTLDELAYLLWCTQGIQFTTDRPVTFRTAPSAGSRHPFETFLLVNNVEGLRPGLYRYLAVEHALVEHDLAAHIPETVLHACNEQRQVRQCAVCFFWVAVVERTTWRYPERGYRYIFLDAGHVCQNLYLAAEQIGSGVCAIGSYRDEDLNPMFGADGVNQFTAYGATVGKKNE